MTVHPLKRLTACSIAVLLFVSSLGGSAAGATVLCSVTPSPTAASTPAEYTIRISGNPVDRADQLQPGILGHAEAPIPHRLLVIERQLAHLLG